MRRNQVILSVAGSLVGISLFCWVVMFLAGHDIWTYVGKPDFWSLSGAPYGDARAFVVAFYVQFFLLGFVLVALVGAAVWQGVLLRRSRHRAT